MIVKPTTQHWGQWSNQSAVSGRAMAVTVVRLLLGLALAAAVFVFSPFLYSFTLPLSHSYVR